MRSSGPASRARRDRGDVNGPTAGLGLLIALYRDIRFSSAAAVFTTAFSRRGLIAEDGMSWMLPKLIGLQNALDLLLSGRKIGAAEALTIGLVSQVLPAATLMEGVRDYACDLASLVSPEIPARRTSPAVNETLHLRHRSVTPCGDTPGRGKNSRGTRSQGTHPTANHVVNFPGVRP